MDPHTTAEIIDHTISLAGCVGGSYFCHYMLINKKTIDPIQIKLLSFARIGGFVGAGIFCILVTATYFGWK